MGKDEEQSFYKFLKETFPAQGMSDEKRKEFLCLLLVSATSGSRCRDCSGEGRFFGQFIPAIKASNQFSEVSLQRRIGIFFVDCLLVKDDYLDENKRCYTIIEYDEEYHSKKSQKGLDLYREDAIVGFLQEEAREDAKEACIEIIRIPEAKEAYAMLYLLPYLAGIETSLCGDKVYEYLDIRKLTNNYE